MTNQTKAVTELGQRVDELERLVQTISRTKLMWEATFDVISDPVLIINRNFDIKRANRTFAKACGIDIRQVTGKKCHKIFAGFDTPCPHCPVVETLASHKNHEAELDMFPQNKRQYCVNAYCMPKVDGAADEDIVLHYRDITEEKKLTKKLMHSEKMAAVGTLAGGVAHEINNPLGGILAFAQLVMRELGEDHPCMDDLKEIEGAVLRCKKIVRDLLDFSHQNFKEEMRLLDMSEVVNRSLKLFKLNERQSKVNIELNTQTDLPKVEGDFNKLEQVVLNLATNAMHAMKENGGNLNIATFTNNDKSKVFMQFKDNGVGIDADVIDRIFDPYFTTKGQGEGTGLGLSICYKIIEEHGGKIDVESKMGAGTTMTIQFPAVAAP